MLFVLIQAFILFFTLICFVDLLSFKNFLLAFNPAQRAARQFSFIVSKFFDIEGVESSTNFLRHRMKSFEESVDILFTYIAPDLYPHRRLYLDVLQCRKEAHECRVDASMDSVTRSCHQFFMCAVFQYRMCGELRNPRPVIEFNKFFRKFIVLKKERDLIKRLMEIGTELRQIEIALTCCDSADADALKLRYDICVDEIQSTLGGSDPVKPFLYNTAYEPKIERGI
jgi:hypothetical protein